MNTIFILALVQLVAAAGRPQEAFTGPSVGLKTDDLPIEMVETDAHCILSSIKACFTNRDLVWMQFVFYNCESKITAATKQFKK